MRLLPLLLALAGCSLVNSTTDLRDQPRPDGGADQSMDSAIDGDASAVDEGADAPENDATTDAPDETVDMGLPSANDCVGDFTLAVANPSALPAFQVSFAEAATCAGAVDVTTDGFSTQLSVETGQIEATFEYDGPRVPLFDAQERQRTFDIGGSTTIITMPVEQLQAYQDDPATDDDFDDGILNTDVFTFGGIPSVDIANNGDVVFESTERLLGAGATRPNGGNIFLWLNDGADDERSPDGVDGRATINQPGTGPDGAAEQARTAPRINDDGSIIAYINRTQGGVEYSFFNVSGERAYPGADVAGGSHLDLRTFGGRSFLLIHNGRANNVYLFDPNPETAPTITSLVMPMADPGLLFFRGGEAGYAAAVDDKAARVEAETGRTDQTNCLGPARGTRVRAGNALPGSSTPDLVYTANCNTSQLAVRNNEQFPIGNEIGVNWLLMDGSDNLDVLLIRGGDMPFEGFSYALRGANPVDPPPPGEEFISVPLAIDGLGTRVRSERTSMDGASVSPNGAWAVWTIASGADMQVFRAPIR